MFEKLVIKNFQRHSYLEIDLDEKVTTIVGPSDVGKSAVIRSLRWLCQNSPSGIEFLKNGTASVSAKLYVDGKEIERVKSPSNNTYSVDGVDLRAFGQGVPASVADVLNVDDINFQAQFDPPYWLTLTPGEVSRQLNSLIDLSIIDETMKNINRTFGRVKVELELAEDKDKKKKIQLDEMQWVSECEMDFEVVKAADKLLEEKRIDLEDLKILEEHLLSAFVTLWTASSKLSAVLEVGKLSAHIRKEQQVLDGVVGVLSAVEALQATLQFRTVSTEAVDSSVVAVEKQRTLLQSLLRIRNEYRAAAPLAKMRGVEEVWWSIEEARSDVLSLKNVLASITEMVAYCKTKDDEIDLHLLHLSQVLVDIEEKTKGQICPVCGKFGL